MLILPSFWRSLASVSLAHSVETPLSNDNRPHNKEDTGLRGGKMRKLTHDEQVAAIAKVNPDVEILGEITGNNVKVPCRCKICHHKWETKPNCIKNGHGCPECVRKRVTEANTKSHEDYLKEIEAVNKNVEVLGEIKNNRTKVLCLCKTCGHEWNTEPFNLKAGHGCPECKKVKASNRMRMPHIKHVAAIAKINPNVEVLGEIINDSTKVLCRCKVCRHEWNARPNDLKHGYGCPRCAKHGFHSHAIGKLYIMVDDLELPTMMKIGVSVREDRNKQVLRSAHKAGVIIPALHVAKTWEGPTGLMQRIEQIMHENYEEWNIKFPAKFDGCTEFFQYTPETAEAFDIIEETLHEIINANKAA